MLLILTGWAVQQVAYQQSATGQDIITHIVYDSFGRQTLDSLPFASSQNNLGYIDSSTLISEIVKPEKRFLI